MLTKYLQPSLPSSFFLRLPSFVSSCFFNTTFFSIDNYKHNYNTLDSSISNSSYFIPRSNTREISFICKPTSSNLVSFLFFTSTTFGAFHLYSDNLLFLLLLVISYPLFYISVCTYLFIVFYKIYCLFLSSFLIIQQYSSF